jgi:hypothetical protein
LLPIQRCRWFVSLQAKGFGTFASALQNGFVAVRVCFMTVSRPKPAVNQQKDSATVS